MKLDAFRTLQLAEEAGLERRLERLREEEKFVVERERGAQEEFRKQKEEAEALGNG